MVKRVLFFPFTSDTRAGESLMHIEICYRLIVPGNASDNIGKGFDICGHPAGDGCFFMGAPSSSSAYYRPRMK